MPIPIEEFANPGFTKYRKGWTISRIPVERAKFSEITWMEGNDTRRYRNGRWPRAGFNPVRDSIRTERVRIDNDSITLDPH